MLFIYAIFMLFYSWCVAIKYYRMNKKGLLVNSLPKNNKLFVILGFVFILLLLLTGYQSFEFFHSIFNSNIEDIIELPIYLSEYAVFGNIGLSLLKILWIPTKIVKYILQIVMGTLSVFVFYSHNCLENNIKLPIYLRNILYSLCVLDIVYIIVSLF